MVTNNEKWSECTKKIVVEDKDIISHHKDEEGCRIASSCLNHEEFHIDQYNRPIYSERYDEVYEFKGGFAVVKSGEHYFHIRPDGSRPYTTNFCLISDVLGGIEIGYNDEGKFQICREANSLVLYPLPPGPGI